MEVGLRGNRAVLLQQFIGRGDHTLRPGFEFWITGAANLWIPATAPSDAKLVINNATAAALMIVANGGTPISGIARSTGVALPGSDRVRILPGQQASFVMGDRGWIAQGCEPPALVFAYNGTPLSNNSANPLNASDLFHYLGGVGTYTNPATNGTITAVARSTTSDALWMASNLTNRATSGPGWSSQNIANSWVGWIFPGLFACTGFLIRLHGTEWSSSRYDPRNLEIRTSSSSTLSSSTDVSGFSLVQAYSNQTQLTGSGAYFYLAISNPVATNLLVIRQTGLNSFGDNYFVLNQVCLFGDYFT